MTANMKELTQYDLVYVKAGSHVYGPLQRYNAETLTLNLAREFAAIEIVDKV